MLRKMNCDFIQGYYMSKPMDSDLAIKWCSKQKKFYMHVRFLAN